MWQRRRKRGIQLTVSKTRDTTRMQGYGSVKVGISSNDSAPLPPTDMKADEATPKMLTRISKWQKDEAKYTLLVEWTNQQK